MRELRVRLATLAAQAVAVRIRDFTLPGRLDLKRAAIVVAVALMHVAMLYILIDSLALRSPPPQKEIEITFGGPVALREVVKPPPKVVLPDLPAPPVAPPPVVIKAEAAAAPAGSPHVTAPAQALADAHTFPVLPAAFRQQDSKIVRLLLSIGEDGSVSAAEIAVSSGAAALDELAIAWVKQHWRYRAALRDGVPVAVKTMAVVTFSRTAG
jgi:TonB family protein